MISYLLNSDLVAIERLGRRVKVPGVEGSLAIGKH